MASAAQLAEIPQHRTEFFSSPRNRKTVISLLLALLTILAYNPAAHNNFVSFDDPAYITANPHLRSGLNWTTIKWAFRSTEQANWHPVTWISHAFDYQVFHGNPAGHHYMSVLLHATTAILLFLFLQAATGFMWRSSVVAALFAIHPINVESVAWAAERKNVLCALFLVLTLMAYRWYAQQENWRRYSLVLLLFVLGLMSKPMLVTLPFLLLLLDYWPLERTRVIPAGQLIAEKLPLLVLSAGSCAITMVAQKAEGAIHSSDFTLSNRMQNAVLSYGRYLAKAIFPAKLASFYSHSQHIPLGQVTLAAAVLVLITVVVAVHRQHKYLAVGWFWFLGAMVPVIGIIQVGEQAMADRYAYLPFVGLFIATVWAVADYARARKIPATYLAGPTFCILGAMAAVTHHQIRFWHDTKTLWTHTLSITEQNYVAEASLGAELIAEGQIQEAIKHLKAGIAINPHDPFSWLDLGVCEKRLGNLNEAVENYETALRLAWQPSLRTAAYGNLGSLYRSRGDYAQATANYEAALALDSDDVVALTGLGVIAQKTGSPAHAAEYYSRAARVQPSDAEFLLLSQVLAQVGRQQEAQTALARAQQISPNWNQTLATVDHLLQ